MGEISEFVNVMYSCKSGDIANEPGPRSWFRMFHALCGETWSGWMLCSVICIQFTSPRRVHCEFGDLTIRIRASIEYKYVIRVL